MLNRGSVYIHYEAAMYMCMNEFNIVYVMFIYIYMFIYNLQKPKVIEFRPKFLYNYAG